MLHFWYNFFASFLYDYFFIECNREKKPWTNIQNRNKKWSIEVKIQKIDVVPATDASSPSNVDPLIGRQTGVICPGDISTIIKINHFFQVKQGQSFK